MTIYDRPDEKVLAESAHAGEVIEFPDILRGWGIAFDQTGGLPPVEWVNGLARRADRAIRYFMQRGLPEWSATEDYPQGAYIQYAGNAYLSKRANTNKQPSANVNDWGRWSVTRDEFDAGTTGRLLNIQVITASRIFAKTAGTRAIQAFGVGAGGAGGGTGATSSGQVAAAGGGAAGAFAVSNLITAGFDGTAVTIGAGGVPVAGGSGGAGGATSFGAFLSAPGGAGAVVQSSQPLPGFGAPGQNSAVPSGSALAYGSTGNDGLHGTTFLAAVTLGGKGADSLYGAGGGSPGTSSSGVKADGRAGKGYGSGGSGGATASSGPASIGGAGSPGLIIVFEYS